MSNRELRPSGMKRVMECPGSVALSRGIVVPPSPYAEEGTAAHRLAQTCLVQDTDADVFLNWHIAVKDSVASLLSPDHAPPPGHSDWSVTEEMVEAVQLYLDEVRRIRSECSPEAEMHVEADLSLACIEGFTGTADVLIVDPVQHKLFIIDLKYGKGIPVEATRNVQEMCYAAMAVQRFHNYSLDDITLVIIQPRGGAYAVKTWQMDSAVLLDFLTEMLAVVDEAMKPNARLCVGEHCKFCPAATIPGHCKALEQKVTDDLMADFAPSGAIKLPTVERMAPEKLAMTLQNVSRIEDYIKNVRAYALEQAEAGFVPPGFKLVQKRARRAWDDERQVVEHLLHMGYDKENLYERELKSPAQMEALVGRKRKEELSHLWTSKSSGVTLAPIDDDRAPQSDAITDFAA